MSEALNDGGPAYPQNFEIMASGEVVSTGNLTPSGFQGLSLRDWFAGQALATLAKGNDPYYAAAKSYEMADAMLSARKRSLATEAVNGDD